MKPVVITGCQRSGTAWIAAVVTACGYWCSHERFIREEKRFPLRPDVIESSWSAVPSLPDLDAWVVHQVRHPLRVVASCLARGTFSERGADSVRWAAVQHPAIRGDGDDELHRALRYWFEWNRLAEPHADQRWRLEDLAPEVIAETLSGFGRPTTPDRAALAIDVVPGRVNRCPTAGSLTWDDIPAGPLKKRVRKLAAHYGYRT